MLTSSVVKYISGFRTFGLLDGRVVGHSIIFGLSAFSFGFSGEHSKYHERETPSVQRLFLKKPPPKNRPSKNRPLLQIHHPPHQVYKPEPGRTMAMFKFLIWTSSTTIWSFFNQTLQADFGGIVVSPCQIHVQQQMVAAQKLMLEFGGIVVGQSWKTIGGNRKTVFLFGSYKSASIAP